MKIFQTPKMVNVYDIDRDNIPFEEYGNVYENEKYNDSDLEELFEYFNLWSDKDGMIEQTFRSLSAGDIVEQNGKFWFCDSIGWKDVTNKCITENFKR